MQATRQYSHSQTTRQHSLTPRPGVPHSSNQSIAPNTTPSFAATDLGNAERFAYQHASTARFCPQWRKWLLWDGTRWALDTRGEVYLKAKETIRSILDEAQRCPDSAERRELIKWELKSESSQRIQAMISLAEKEPGIAILVEELDTKDWLLNLPNGTVNLQAGCLQDHNPEDLITKVAGTIFDEEAQCHQFLAYLDKVFQSDAALISYVQRAVGYSLAGVRREQMVLFLLGLGSNGKTLLIVVLLALFGEYGHTIDPSLLMLRHGERMATGLAECQGKRFVACSESNDGRRLDEALVKQITGGEPITAERKYENPFTFIPQFQIWFSSNHKPETRGTDHGLWRRLQMVPFPVRFWDADKGEEGPEHLRANKALLEILLAELPGILQWAIRGCLEWQIHGLTAPATVKEATASYRNEQDVVGAFLREYCFTGDPETTRELSKDLYRKYIQYCEETGERPVKQKSFGISLGERGFNNYRQPGTGASMWKGVALKH